MNHTYKWIGILDMKYSPFCDGLEKLVPASIVWTASATGCTMRIGPFAPYLDALRF